MKSKIKEKLFAPEKEENEEHYNIHELGKKRGKEILIRKLIELLELDERYAAKHHSHTIEN